MTISLTIDNADSLADGGPLTYTSRGRGFEIGREGHLDWTLPDPNLVISGRHCEVRFENGAYWLHDVSRNGTFVNGSHMRAKSPYRLEDGDRLQIGHYLIAVSVRPMTSPDAFAAERREDAFVQSVRQATGESGIWDTGAPAPAPIPRRDLMPPPKRARQDVDFSEQYLDLPDLRPSGGFDPFANPAPAAAAGLPQGPVSGGTNPFAQQGAPAPIPSVPPRMPQASPFDLPDQGFGAPPPPFSQGPAPMPPVPAPMPRGVGASVPASPPFFVESEPFAPVPRADPFAGQPAPQPASMPPAAYQHQSAPPLPPAYQQPAYSPPPQPASPPPAGRAGSAELLGRIAHGAGVSVDIFSSRDPGEVAEEIGQVLRATIEELTQLLKARAAAKVMARSSNRTMISAVDNNPLKFIPRPEEAIEIMFARRRAGYLDARRTVQESFADLKTHEIATYAAMQKALARLLEDLSPEAIEKKVSGSAFASKKGRAWDTFVATWEAKSTASEHGMLDVFLAHFADAYEKASKRG